MIERTPVVSTNIASIGYDPENQILEVEFVRSSGVYRYYNVPQDTYDSLLSAKSKGEYFHQKIKGKFDHMRQH